MVISMHRPEAISGINAWGARMGRVPLWCGSWLTMVVGAEVAAAEAQGVMGQGAIDVGWHEEDDSAMQVLAVVRALAARGPCVVVGNDSPHAYVAGALLRHRGVRVLGVAHTAHEADEDFFQRCGPLADRWVAVSEGAAVQFGRWLTRGGVEPAVIPCGVVVCERPAWSGAVFGADDVLRSDTSKDSTLRLLYAGRLDKRCKRVLDLAALAEVLSKRGVSFVLTVAGDGSAREELRTAVRSHVALGRVRLPGRVAASEMPRLYAMHDVLVLTSAFEGSPVTVAEAMAAGRTVAITTGCGEAARLVRDGVEGIVVPVGDMRQMGARLAVLAGDRVSLARMGLAAHRLAQRAFDINAHARVYANVASTCMGAPVGYCAEDMESLREHWHRVMQAMALIGGSGKESVRKLARWWVRDVGANELALSGLLLTPPRFIGYAERKFREALRVAEASGVERIGLFGAGRHTRNLAEAIAESARVVAIVDDRAGASGGLPREIAGRPVVQPSEARRFGVQAVVISSDEHEEALATRAKEALPDVAVVRMYGG